MLRFLITSIISVLAIGQVIADDDLKKETLDAIYGASAADLSSLPKIDFNTFNGAIRSDGIFKSTHQFPQPKIPYSPIFENLVSQVDNLPPIGVPEEKSEIGNAVLFVSFSMPISTIKTLFNDAKKINIPLVLNGLVNNSMKETSLALRSFYSLEKKNEVQAGQFIIDPTLYTRFNVKSVPTLVIALENIKPCSSDKNCDIPSFRSVSGAVKLDYLLESIGNENDDFKAIVAPYQQNLEPEIL